MTKIIYNLKWIVEKAFQSPSISTITLLFLVCILFYGLGASIIGMVREWNTAHTKAVDHLARMDDSVPYHEKILGAKVCFFGFTLSAVVCVWLLWIILC
jgi:hypothetical protein